MENESNSLKTRVISASKWATLGELAYRGIPPLIFLFLATILHPDDFGIVATSIMVVALSQIFWDAGLNKAFIQSDFPESIAANTCFWINIILSIILYVIVFFSAEILATLLEDPRITTVIRIQSVQIMILAFSSIHMAIFQKHLTFRPLFIVKLISSLLPGLISIPLALSGFGVWALVWGAISGSILQTMTLWLASDWRPKFNFDLQIAKKLILFGRWIVLSGILSWCYLWLDTLILGTVTDVHTMGIYRLGNTFVIMIFGLTLSPLLPVLFSTLSSIKHDQKRTVNIANRATRYISYVALPLSMVLFIIGDSIEALLFHNEWVGIGIAITALGLMHGFGWLVGSYSEAYKAIGKPQVESYIMMFGLIYTIPIYYWAATQGFFIFVWARVFIMIINTFVHLYFMKLFLSIKYSTWVSMIFPATISLVPGFAISHVMKNFLPLESHSLVILFPLFTALLVYAGTLYLIDKDFFENDVVASVKALVKTR